MEVSMFRSEWKEYYRNYRSLQYSWQWNNAPCVLREQAFIQILASPKDPNLVREEMQKWGYGLCDEEQWNNALQLRIVILALPNGWSTDEPLEDVYQAALRMETSHGVWNSDMGKSKIFRGQRRHQWKVIPHLFRGMPTSQDNTNSLVISLEKISGLVRQLQASDQSITEEEGVAIVQHYSEELG
jgi:hypothetical protein